MQKKIDALNKKLKPEYRVRRIDDKKYLKKFDWKDSLPTKVEWTNEIEESMILGEMVIAPVMNYLRKVKRVKITFESTQISRHILKLRNRLELVKRLVKHEIRNKYDIVDRTIAKPDEERITT